MPSKALKRWKKDGQAALDDIEAAHRAVGGKGRGRRWATLQVNHAYAMMVSSQFQAFCRGLHSEAVDVIAAKTQPPDAALVLRMLMTDNRKLDHGNPNAGNLGSDFRAIGMVNFWDQVRAVSPATDARKQKLDDLNIWRNAVAHQDWKDVGDQRLALPRVRAWRSACRALAGTFDKAVKLHLKRMVGRGPW